MYMRGLTDGAAPRRAVALVAAVFLLLLIVNQYTGFINQTVSIGVSVAASTQSNIYVINVSSVAIQDQQSEFKFAMDNIGSRPLDGAVFIEIQDSNGTRVDSFNSSAYSIQPGSYITYIAQWYATPSLGNYTLVVWDNYTNPTDSDSANFSIQCQPGSYKCFGSERRSCGVTSWDFVQNCVYGCSGGSCQSAPPEEGGAGGGVSVGAGATYSIIVDHEGSLDVIQQTNYTYLIRITNDGSSTLTNVTISAWSDTVSVRVPDIRVASLEPGESTFFVLDIGVPDLVEGTYWVQWMITANELTEPGEVLINLLPLGDVTPEIRCSMAIDRYFDMLESLDMDIRSADIRGYDMAAARELLTDALEELEVMRTLKDTGLNEECTNRIDVLRRKIEQTAMVYAIAISRPVSIIAYPWVEHTILVFTVISLVVVIVVILGWRRIKDWYNRNKLFMPRRW
jgi:hypothetical protein